MKGASNRLLKQVGASMEPLVVGRSLDDGSGGPVIVFLHGLGDTGKGWEDIAEAMVAMDDTQTWVLPTAHSMAVTLNNHITMPAWYDLEALETRAKETLKGFDQSCEYVTSLAKQVQKEINKRPLFIGGFSQGGAIALSVVYNNASLVNDLSIAGCIGLSTYSVDSRVNDAKAKHIPLLMCHGTADPVVDIRWSRPSFDKLQREGELKDAVFKTYSGLQHSIDDRVLMDLAQFLNRNA